MHEKAVQMIAGRLPGVWRKWKRVALVLAGGILLAIVMLFFSGTTQVAHEALQYQLNAVGQTIYEYHTNTGHWPSAIDDLGETSLPLRLHYWRPMLQSGSIVVVWHDNLKADPKDNADVILAYHNRGLLAQFGRQWVCWGDLRTEYTSSKRLRAALGAAQH
jgi:hypothetical protein